MTGTKTKASKSKALAKVEPAAVALTDKIEDLRQGGFLADIDATEDRLDAMVSEILNATDDEGIVGGTTPIAQLVGQVVRIDGANFLPSSFREHPFAVFRYEAADGRRGVATNGGTRLVAQLARAVELGRVKKGWTVKVSSAQVEYDPGHYGDTFFFTRPDTK